MSRRIGKVCCKSFPDYQPQHVFAETEDRGDASRRISELFAPNRSPAARYVLWDQWALG